MKLSLPPRITKHTLILFLAGAIVASNIFHLTVMIYRNYWNEPLHLEPGSQFARFKPYLQHTPKIGYITDKGTSRETNDGTFLQAQYFLAPTIIERNAIHHPFIMIDSTNKPYILRMVTILNAKGVAHNPYGQALLKRQFP